MAWFNVAAEINCPPPTDEQIGTLTTAIGEYHGAAGTSQRGNLSVRVSVQAESLRQAVNMACLVVDDAVERAGLGADLLSVEAMPEEEFDTREEIPTITDPIGAQDAAEILGVSRQRITQTAQRLGGFLVSGKWVFSRALVERARREPPQAEQAEELRDEAERAIWAMNLPEGKRRVLLAQYRKENR